jgi:Protein of unknown function (DUF1360)
MARTCTAARGLLGDSAVTLLVVALAGWRTYRLLASDAILDRPRAWLAEERPLVDDFVACPFCLGFWVAFAWTLLYAGWPEGAFWIALPFAFSAALVFIERLHGE